MYVHILFTFSPIERVAFHDSEWFSFSQNNLVYQYSFSKEQWKLLRKVSGFFSIVFCLIAKIAAVLKCLFLTIIFSSSGKGPESESHQHLLLRQKDSTLLASTPADKLIVCSQAVIRDVYSQNNTPTTAGTLIQTNKQKDLKGRGNPCPQRAYYCLLLAYKVTKLFLRNRNK